jgi:DNA-directed RNA polymerase specialized sigma24 family protein
MKRRDLRLRRRSHALDQELAAFTYSLQDGLLRTAYLLTGDEWTARHLVERALVRLYLGRWRLEPGRADHQARRLLLQEYGGLPDQPGKGADTGTVWGTVQGFPATRRAVAVLLFHDELAEEDVADLLGVDVEVVRSEAGHVLAEIRARGFGQAA